LKGFLEFKKKNHQKNKGKGKKTEFSTFILCDPTGSQKVAGFKKLSICAVTKFN
jgi:hypothetical protein